MPGRKTPVRSSVKDPDAWLDEQWLSEEDERKHAGKWIVAYRGEIIGVGRTLEAAERRARGTGKIPPDAELFSMWLAPDSLIF